MTYQKAERRQKRVKVSTRGGVGPRKKARSDEHWAAGCRRRAGAGTKSDSLASRRGGRRTLEIAPLCRDEVMGCGVDFVMTEENNADERGR